jgi:hypothetical protein
VREAGPGGAGPSRRTILGVLGGGLGLAVPVLGGCSGEAEPAAPPADLAGLTLLVGAITSEQGLIAAYEAARRAHPSLARHIDGPLAHHREHLAVLRRHYVPGTGSRATEGPALPGPPRAQQAPDEESETLEELRGAESKAAAARLAEVARAAPGMAQLLASIGACEAGHAASLALVRT